ncbi:hypothetical protein [Glycomyces tenuis]|uniref:hypothetical protein n=1 Tax=Glycomyces tenuis TaxID=58116 RepID=UPI000411E7EF|nr:hypothetical protein [Glycomyces tenuis]
MALAASFGVSVAQVLTIVLVYVLWWSVVEVPPEPQSDWEIVKSLLVCLLTAHAVAMIVGPALALLLRLRLAMLYALAPVAALGSLVACGFPSWNAISVLAFALGTAWNFVVVALADRRA